MLDPHKPKYYDLYWNVAYAAADNSAAVRRKVGAAVITPTGMISIGWNGTPVGFDNCCEEETDHQIYFPSLKRATSVGKELKTRPEVIHAERNAIDKMTRQGISTHGSLLFVTMAPCFECAKAIHGLGFKAIYYDEVYRDMAGAEFLEKTGVTIAQRATVQ